MQYTLRDRQQERIAEAKSRAVHTQGQATVTYSRGKITRSTHSGTSDRSVKQRQNHVQYTHRDRQQGRIAGAKSRAVHTLGQVKRNVKQGQNHVQYTHRDRQQERIARAKSRAVHTQGQATGTYSRGEITCSTHPGASKKERKAGAKSRAVHTYGHIAYRHGEYQVFDWKSSVGLFRIAVNTVGGTNSGHKLDI